MQLNCCTQYASKFGKLSSCHRMEKVSFYPNPIEGQCQRMFKLLCNCAHFTSWQGFAQNLLGRVQQYVN